MNQKDDLFYESATDKPAASHALFEKLIADISAAGRQLTRELGYKEYAVSVKPNVTKTETNYPVEFHDIPYPFDENNGKNKMVTSSIAVLVEKSDRSDFPKCVEVRINGKAIGNLILPDGAVIKEQYQKRDGERELTGYKVFIKLGGVDALKYVEALIRWRLVNYVSSFPVFGCCHLYQECSDARKCLQENRSYAGACQYKRNLDVGRIFYGKNRNVAT